MSEAIYILQQDCIRNGKRLDFARQLVEDLLFDMALGNMPRDRYEQILECQKILRYTKATQVQTKKNKGD